jgi:hypothetical protein
VTVDLDCAVGRSCGNVRRMKKAAPRTPRNRQPLSTDQLRAVIGGSFLDYFEDFVIKGNNGEDQEKSG